MSTGEFGPEQSGEEFFEDNSRALRNVGEQYLEEDDVAYLDELQGQADLEGQQSYVIGRLEMLGLDPVTVLGEYGIRVREDKEGESDEI